MKLKYKYSFQEYDNRYLAIVDFLETEDERRMLWVNECGKMIMELLHTDITRFGIINALTERYSGDVTAIETTVDDFIKQLSDAGLLINM